MTKKLILLGLATLMLTACGGSSDKPLFGGQAGLDPEIDEDKPYTANTYYPLDVYEQGKEYVEDDAFKGLVFDEFIFTHMIAPVNAASLKAATNPSIDDYELTINEEAVTKDEHGLMMQKVVGLPVQLKTALVVDMSPSNAVDKQKFIAAVKQYITSAQASADPTIKSQEFTVLGFASKTKWYVEDFTSDVATLNAGLDQLKIDWEGQSLGNYSALYQSIVAAVGSYVGGGASEITEVDYSVDGDNDLNERYRTDASGKQLDHLVLGSVVVFGSGSDTMVYFSLEDAQAALKWQSYLIYDEEKEVVDTGVGADDASADSDDAGQVDGMILAGKPLYYVSLGKDKVAKNINELSTQVIDASSSAKLNFSGALIEHQAKDVKTRSRLDNLYMVRYAVPQRDGKINIEFSSHTATRNHAFTIELSFDEPLDLDEPLAGLEITGSNNNYLAGGKVSVSQVTSLYPAIRWDAFNNYSLNDSTWSVGGVTRAKEVDGSIKITAADIGKEVTLNNGSLPTATIQIVK